MFLRLWSADRERSGFSSPLCLSNLGKVSNIFVPAFPSCKRKGMPIPCCRGPLKINLLSETDSEPRKTCVRVGFPARALSGVFFSQTHGPGDPPGNLPRFKAITVDLSAPSWAHRVSSCFGKPPCLPPCWVGLLTQRGRLCAPLALAGCREWTCPAWLLTLEFLFPFTGQKWLV